MRVIDRKQLLEEKELSSLEEKNLDFDRLYGIACLVASTTSFESINPEDGLLAKKVYELFERDDDDYNVERESLIIEIKSILYTIGNVPVGGSTLRDEVEVVKMKGVKANMVNPLYLTKFSHEEILKLYVFMDRICSEDMVEFEAKHKFLI